MDARPFLAAKCRGVSPSYRDRRADDDGRGARRFNKEAERVREHRKRIGVIIGDSETPRSSFIKKNSVAAIPTQKTQLDLSR